MSEQVAPWLWAALLALAAALLVLATPSGLAAPAVALMVLAMLVVTQRHRPAPAEETAADTADGAADLSQVIAPLAEGVLLIDGGQRVVAANQAAAGIVGRPLGSMLGVSLVQAVRDHELAEVARAARGLAIPVRVSASEHDVLATATRVDAGLVRTLLVIEDITELERVRRARAELISNLSHELRTPVAAARALSETLQMGVDDEAQRQRFQDRLAEEIQRIGAMVERLLRLSRLESGGEAFTLEAFDPVEALATAASRLDPIARQRGVSIQAPAGGGTLPPVRGDRERVQEVLANLLDNALRYSPEGGTVRMAAIPDEAVVRFEVADDGPGILPSDQSRVFERFYTGDRARSTTGGAGLGLSIARHIVQRLGGTIWVADRAPGATVCFTVPIALAAASGGPAGLDAGESEEPAGNE